MSAYIGVDGKARKIKSIYVGVDNVAKKVLKAYVGINGKARKFYDSAAGADIPHAYLTFSSDNDFTISTNGNIKSWNGTMLYSTDRATWEEWDGTHGVSSENGKLYLCGKNNTVVTNASTGNGRFAIESTAEGFTVSCSGNIETLLDYATVENGVHPTMGNYCFSYLFASWKSLVAAPELNAVRLSNYCYAYMFQGCTALSAAPELPFLSTSTQCCVAMFSGCTSLTTPPPALLATTTSQSCYASMFSGCTSLTTPPSIKATGTMAVSACYSMFSGCTSLVSIPYLYPTVLGTRCYYQMFLNCRSIVVYTSSHNLGYIYLDVISANEGTDACYGMFGSVGAGPNSQRVGELNYGMPDLKKRYYCYSGPVIY